MIVLSRNGSFGFSSIYVFLFVSCVVPDVERIHCYRDRRGGATAELMAEKLQQCNAAHYNTQYNCGSSVLSSLAVLCVYRDSRIFIYVCTHSS